MRDNDPGLVRESLPRTFRGLAAPHPGRNANQRPRKAADLQFLGATTGFEPATLTLAMRIAKILRDHNGSQETQFRRSDGRTDEDGTPRT